MRFCTKCGGQNDDLAQNCATCQAPLGPGNVDYQPAGAAWDAQPFSAPGQVQAGGMPGAGLAMRGEKREPGMVIVYTLLTCGVYGIWWWFTVMTEVKNALNRQEINPGMDLVLGLVTCGVYMVYLHYKYPKLMVEMQARAGVPQNDISTVCMILPFVGLGVVSIFMMQTELNKIWDGPQR